MASREDLKRFIVQLEWTAGWVDMTDEEMGILFKNFIAYAKGEELNLENRMVKSNWLGVVSDIDRINEKYLRDIENGKKGGAPKGNKNATKQPKYNPQTTQEQPLNNPKTSYKEKEKEKDIVDVVAVELPKQPTLVSYQFVKNDNPDVLELFTYMFAEFKEKDSEFDGLYDLWIKLPSREQEDSVSYASNYIKYCVEKKKKISLYYYLSDKKYNWDTIRK